MRVRRKQVVINILNALKYPKEYIVDCSLISSWDSLVHKKIIKSKEELEKKLGEEDKDVLVREGIISVNLLLIKDRMENFESLKIIVELLEENVCI